MNRPKSKMLVGVLAAVLALAVAVPAFAGTDDTSTQAVTCGNEAWGGGQGQGGMRGLGAGGQMSVRISESLGIEPADLAAERQAGKSLAEIAESKGVNTDTPISTMLEARRVALADAVADGRITQEQADVMLQNMGERIADRIDGTEVGPPADRGRGARGSGGQEGCGTCTGSEG